MKIEAKQRLVTANWQDDLHEIKNPNIVNLVKKLGTRVKIIDLLTDGYDGSGCEVHIKADTKFAGSYEPAISGKLLTAIGGTLLALGKNLDISFGVSPNDSDEYILVIAG